MSRHPRLQEDHHNTSGDFALPGAPRRYAPDLELEPVHRDIELVLDFDTASAEGRVTIHLASRAPSARRLILDAHDLENVSVVGSVRCV